MPINEEGEDVFSLVYTNPDDDEDSRDKKKQHIRETIDRAILDGDEVTLKGRRLHYGHVANPNAKLYVCMVIVQDD